MLSECLPETSEARYERIGIAEGETAGSRGSSWQDDEESPVICQAICVLPGDLRLSFARNVTKSRDKVATSNEA